MPGLEGDLEVWQTQEVNVSRGEVEDDIDLEGLPFLKVNRGPRHYLYNLFLTVLLFHAHILKFTKGTYDTLTKGAPDKVFVGDNATRSVLVTISFYISVLPT